MSLSFAGIAGAQRGPVEAILRAVKDMPMLGRTLVFQRVAQ